MRGILSDFMLRGKSAHVTEKNENSAGTGQYIPPHNYF